MTQTEHPRADREQELGDGSVSLSIGCQPHIEFHGTPSETGGSGFDIQATEVMNRTWSMFVYSTTGSDDLNYYSGTLCITDLLHRGPVLLSTGVGPPGKDCSGSLSFDFNA